MNMSFEGMEMPSIELPMSIAELSFFSTTTSGSKLLEPLCDTIGLPIDKVNFLFAHLLFIPLALVYKLYLTKTYIPITLRHLYLLIPGLSLGFFCFGYLVLNLVFLTLITYFLILFCPVNVVQRFVFSASVIYLSCLHLARQIYDYGSYTIDITGSSMIMVQKISLLGFSLHDGLSRRFDSLLDTEKRVAIKRKPTLIEYLSFVFTFPTFLSGPTIHYSDYIDFVEGTSYTKHLKKIDANNNIERPSSTLVWLEKLSTSILFGILTVYLTPLLPVNRLIEDSYLQNTSLILILIYIIVSTTCARFKYYHAWKIGESHLNCCGFGFNGYEEGTKKPKWDLLSCVDIIPFEFSLSLKTGLDYWNKTTQTWLRFVAYDRIGKFKILYTYLLSALWYHGFYPGYYLTFLAGGIFTQAGRSLRRHFRPLFLGNKHSKQIYDILTFIATKFSIGYLCFPFVLLELNASLKVYHRVYFIGHVVCLFAIFVLPSLIRLFRKPPSNSSSKIEKEKLDKEKNVKKED